MLWIYAGARVLNLLDHSLRLAIPNRSTALRAIALCLLLASCTVGRSPGDDFSVDLYTGRDVIGGTSVSYRTLMASGRPMILNFFGGACPPCVEEMPLLEAAWREHGAEIVFLGVDVGPYTGLGSFVEGASLVADLGVTFPAGSTDEVSVIPSWQIHGLPETFFIKPDGTLSSHWPGALTASQLEREIADLLE